MGAVAGGDMASKVSGGFILSPAADKPNSPGNASRLVKWGKLLCVWFGRFCALGLHGAGEWAVSPSLTWAPPCELV